MALKREHGHRVVLALQLEQMKVGVAKPETLGTLPHKAVVEKLKGAGRPLQLTFVAGTQKTLCPLNT